MQSRAYGANKKGPWSKKKKRRDFSDKHATERVGTKASMSETQEGAFFFFAM